MEAALAEEFYGSDFYAEIKKEKRNYSLDMKRKIAKALRQSLKVAPQDVDKVTYDTSASDDNSDE